MEIAFVRGDERMAQEGLEDIKFMDVQDIMEVNERDIAIIGISARLPKADTLEAFWENLVNERNCIDDIPDTRMKDIKAYLELSGKLENISMPKAAYLDRIDCFDYEFFHISPQQAKLMDPHHRIFLETAWNAIEDAGYGDERIVGTDTGVFVGFNPRLEYKRMILDAEEASLADSLTGSLPSALAGMVSYLLDLRGPNMNINTACSSSLAALHVACQSIRNKECSMALTGSVRLSLMPNEDMDSSDIGIASKDSKAKVFDDDANGSTGGEGAVVMLLKPLSIAIEDRDNIYAVIKGSGMNCDGRSASLTSPNPKAQARVIRKTWEDARMDPETISYIETHGTGTGLGDPIEVQGINEAFCDFTSRKQFCAIGSVKTNMGHLDTAAGILGVLKAVCSLQHGQIPASLHFQVPNRKILFENSAVYVCKELKSWESDYYPRRCGVTSFGLSGTNVHVIMEEYVSNRRKKKEKEDIRVLALSGGTQAALQRLLSLYQDFFLLHEDIDLDDLCFTCNTGRGHYAYRIAFLFKTRDELIQRLNHVIASNMLSIRENGILYNEVHVTKEDEQKDSVYRSLISQIVEEKNLELKYTMLEQLCQFYISGYPIPWNLLYERKRVYRISAPGYPFEKTRSWIDFKKKKQRKEYETVVATTRDTQEDIAFVKVVGEHLERESQTTLQIAKIWGYYLGYESIKLQADYFQLGGDSIQALKIINAVNETFQINVDVADLLKNPSIQEFSKIVSLKKSQYNKITRISSSEYYDLSAAQRRIFFACMFDSENVRYNLTNAVIINGRIDVKRLEKAIREIVNRHEILRTSYHLVDGLPKMKIHENINMDIACEKLENKEVLEKLEEFRQPFHLDEAPLMRIKLVRIAKDKLYLFYDVHHILFDSFSFGVILNELVALYKGEYLPELKIQYKDYAAWHNLQLTSEKLKLQEDYWISTLKEKLSYSILMPSRSCASKSNYHSDSIWFHIKSEETEKLKSITIQTDTTLFMLLLAVLGVELSKYLEQEDVLIGSPIAGRNHPDTESLIGDFINLIAIRVEADEDSDFLSVLCKVKENCIHAYENQEYPFQNLLKKLDVKLDNENALFNVLFAFHSNLKSSYIGTEDWEIIEGEYDINAATYDITLDSEETEDGITFNLSYSTELYDRAYIERFTENYCKLVKEVIRNPRVRIKELTLLTEEQEEELIKLGTGTVKELKDYTSWNLLEEIFSKHYDSIAIDSRMGNLTYRELDKKSDLLARILQKQGVGKNTVVGILLERTCNIFVAMIGIMKAGGAYLLIDSDFPEERIQYMLEDSKVEIIITTSQEEKISDYRNIDINQLEEYEAKEICENKPAPEDIAYILYTSGSTGKPKGVMVGHRQLYNFILAMKEKLALNNTLSILSLTTVSFDIFQLESICALANGMKLVLADQTLQRDIYMLGHYITERKVDIIQATPSRISMFLQIEEVKEVFASVKMLLIGGEKLDNSLLKQVQEVYSGRIFNMYGPTETTIWSSLKEVTDSEEVTIGKPIMNTTFLILGPNLELRPIGCLGELYIGGSGVAKGYVNNPRLTEEKFVTNPYNTKDRIYKTGDIGRWLFNGEVEVVGRNDNQIKLNGHRIELDEVEEHLRSYEKVLHACVKRWDEENESYLCGYVTSNVTVDFASVKEYLLTKIPQYMVPKYFMQLEEIPLTKNEKVDRNSLPKPRREIQDKNNIKIAKTDIEKRLISIWEKVLHTNEIGVDENFFDIGGDSISLVQLQSQIKKEFECEIDITAFFENSTVTKLVQLLKDDAGYELKPVVLQERVMVKGIPSGKVSEMSYVLPDRLVEEIQNITKKKQVTLEEWLLGVFTYYMRDITEGDSIVIASNIKERNQLIDIIRDKQQEIDKEEQLFTYLSEVIGDARKKEGVPISSLKTDFTKRKENEAVVLFLLAGSNVLHILKQVLDYAVEVENIAGQIRIRVYYSGRLNINAMKELLSRYVKTIQAVTKLFLK